MNKLHIKNDTALEEAMHELLVDNIGDEYSEELKGAIERYLNEEVDVITFLIESEGNFFVAANGADTHEDIICLLTENGFLEEECIGFNRIKMTRIALESLPEWGS